MESQNKRTKINSWVWVVLLGIVLLSIIAVVFYNKLVENREAKLSNQKETYNPVQSDQAASLPHTPIKVVHNKKWGLTRVITCLAQDTNWIMIQQECKDLLVDDQFGFVYCYDDKKKVRDISFYKNSLDALPSEEVDYISELIKQPGEKPVFTKVIKNLKK